MKLLKPKMAVGIEQLERAKFDLTMTDIIMPETEGIEPDDVRERFRTPVPLDIGSSYCSSGTTEEESL